MSGSVCFFCKVNFSKPPFLVRFQHTLEQLTGTSTDKDENKAKIKDKKDKAKEEFFTFINGFLNGKTGSILIHSDGSANIDLLDQNVDDKLLKLIPDNALYQDVYERSFLDDNHVYYRVKPQSGMRPLSILDFNTKFAVSKGLVDPTQGQMRDFMMHVIEEDEKSSALFEAYRGTAVLEEGQPAMVKDFHAQGHTSVNPTGSGSKPFRENICTQAKAYDFKTELTKFCWNKSQLYISAFSKIPGGGAVYIGIAEEKRGDTATGRLIAQGLNANGITKDKIQEELSKQIRKECMYIGRHVPEIPVVETEALPLQSDNSAIVLKIKVNYYHGVYFTCPDGPKLFTCKKQGLYLNPEPVNVKDWLETIKQDNKMQVEHGEDSTV